MISVPIELLIGFWIGVAVTASMVSWSVYWAAKKWGKVKCGME